MDISQLRYFWLRFGFLPRFLSLAVTVAATAFAGPVLAENGIEKIWHQTHWGESSDALIRQFGADATRLHRAFDFGDSYVDVLLPNQTIGGVSMVVFFQDRKSVV